MVNDPTRDDERLPEETATFEGDPPEDPIITRSFEALDNLTPPANFTAEVMFQVRETHLRKRISIRQMMVIAATLLTLTALFFLWDVQDYGKANRIDSFGEAFSQKASTVIDQFDGIIEDTGGILEASWQILKGFLGAFFTNTPWPLQILIFAAVIAAFWLLRKWLF